VGMLDDRISRDQSKKCIFSPTDAKNTFLYFDFNPFVALMRRERTIPREGCKATIPSLVLQSQKGQESETHSYCKNAKLMLLLKALHQVV
jgi:hypothetical protein